MTSEIDWSPPEPRPTTMTWTPKDGTVALSPGRGTSSPQSPGSPFRGQSLLECDYDVNPTYLYQAIEAKQWDHVKKVISAEDSPTQAATWVVRKETSGKLRWRLLPIHASIIFQAPLDIVELLLQEYPIGAQCKDDQGMLPLHLAFRNETAWDVMEELLTAYPHAIGVKDRKGRTPVGCASSAAKKKAGVLELYSQIAISGERQRGLVESRAVLDARSGALQDTHTKTLMRLKSEWNAERKELVAALGAVTMELESFKTMHEQTSEQLSDKLATEGALTQKLSQVTLALNSVNEARRSEEAAELQKLVKREKVLVKANEKLVALVQSLMDQQASLKSELDQQGLKAMETTDVQAKALEEYMTQQKEMGRQQRTQRKAWTDLLEDSSVRSATALKAIMAKTATTIPAEIVADNGATYEPSMLTLPSDVDHIDEKGAVPARQADPPAYTA